MRKDIYKSNQSVHPLLPRELRGGVAGVPPPPPRQLRRGAQPEEVRQVLRPLHAGGRAGLQGCHLTQQPVPVQGGREQEHQRELSLGQENPSRLQETMFRSRYLL